MIDWQQDVRKMYRNTFVPIKDGSKFIPFHVEEIGADDTTNLSTVTLNGEILVSGTTWDYKSFLYEDKSIVKDFPSMGFINSKRACAYLERRPERQWKRGFVPHLVSVLCPVQAELEECKTPFPEMTRPSMLKRLFNREYPSESVAYKRIITGNKLACAFDWDYCYFVKRGHDGVYVGYKRWIVGERTKTRILLQPSAQRLAPELSKFVKVEVGND